jgi:hypothetical protein
LIGFGDFKRRFQSMLLPRPRPVIALSSALLPINARRMTIDANRAVLEK